MDIVDPVAKMAGVEALWQRRKAGLPPPLNPNDKPEDWRFADDGAGGGEMGG